VTSVTQETSAAAPTETAVVPTAGATLATENSLMAMGVAVVIVALGL